MDTITATREVERAAQLRKRIAALNERKGELGSKHIKERAAFDAAEGTRLALVKELAGADAATEGWANSEIDKLDSLLVTLGRKVSALESALAAVEVELEPFTRELTEVESQVQQERRAKALVDCRDQLEQAARRAAESMDTARRNLALLHLAAAKAVDEYALDALRICEPVFAEFWAKQTNLEERGLKRVTAGYQNTAQAGVFIRPMVGS